jgi:DNA (cytosine-5)-methyltransferase 1
LEAQGYEVIPFLLPACGKNAPHRRDRIWFVSRFISNSNGNRFIGDIKSEESSDSIRSGVSFNGTDPLSCDRAFTNANNASREKNTNNREWENSESFKKGDNIRSNALSISRSGVWERFPTKHPVCNGNDGLSSRLDGITFSKWRTESIKAGGNAIVPQVAYEIFKAIQSIST